MSASVGAIRIAKPEHLLHDLLPGCQRFEPPPRHFVQETPKLRIIRHCALEMSLCPPGCDCEDLMGEILAPALLELTFRLEMCPVLLDPFPELRYVLPGRRLRQHDRRLPGAFPVERQDRTHL